MPLDRRQCLRLAHGSAAILICGPVGGCATAAPPATGPWSRAGRFADPRVNALSFAILAPNPHNRQPWTARLIGTDRIEIGRDRRLNLPETDPQDRQLTIGMGCFLELLVLAAADQGYGVDLDLFPDGEEGPVARAVFLPGAGRPDPLFAAVTDRRSCKQPFEDRAVPDDLVRSLEPMAAIITQPGPVAALRALTWDAFLIEAGTQRTWRESVELMRIGRTQIEASPDGIDLDGPLLGTLGALGILSREAQLDTGSFAYRSGITMFRRMLAATPAYAVVTTGSNSRREQIEAGRRWLRLNLATTALGLSLHPVSQCLQEFAEMQSCLARAHAILAPEGGRVQMLGRLGYGPRVPRTPRWPVEAKLVDGTDAP